MDIKDPRSVFGNAGWCVGFDHYSFRARLQPALLTLLPAALGVFSWMPEDYRWGSSMWLLFCTAGGTYLLAAFARNQGKRIEPGLWKAWGGTPTTQMLRHRGPANPIMRRRWHRSLSVMVGRSLPSPEDEIANPEKADELYEAAVKLLIIQTREMRTGLVYKENVQYGYCRNLYGMRWLGVIIALGGSAASMGAAVWCVCYGRCGVVPVAVSIVNICLLLVWIFRINSEWVKIPAMAYAERLLESIETLRQTSARGS